ncbi:MAG: GYF domain-containing protein [Muribaculaceae bacterium]|nr:GYF domain-containing protein [Muribaculaceae bacterium]
MAKRYFAMIDGERCGPFALDSLADAGVRPDTYVWCKGMADWEKAEDVADICRFYRQRIFGLMHPSPPAPAVSDPADSNDGSDPYEEVPLRFREMARRSGALPEGTVPDRKDTSVPPAPTLFLSVMLTLFCFPVTGLVAIYYSYRSRVAWAESQRSESKSAKNLYSDQEREEYKRQAHDYERQAKMWIGITFFLGMILFALLGKKMF